MRLEQQGTDDSKAHFRICKVLEIVKLEATYHEIVGQKHLDQEGYKTLSEAVVQDLGRTLLGHVCGNCQVIYIVRDF